ncbi:unnamed protein product [Larinioides sclopetarius]|uniref:Uncharacterized protein n=1 Tax=Larinioides sclopetarius TaxID=280406 RepID=A0AAV2BC68_9ARAC
MDLSLKISRDSRLCWILIHKCPPSVKSPSKYYILGLPQSTYSPDLTPCDFFLE